MTGNALQQQLEASVSITWKNVPVRDGLARLARSVGVAVFLDRRIDPSLPLEIELHEVPLGEALQQIADDHGLGLAWVRSVAYFGPSEPVGQLTEATAAAIAPVRSLPFAEQKKLLATKAWRWDDFATPRELLAQLATDEGVAIEGLEHVPHDLWAAANLAPLSLVERVLLVAFQYDLAVQVVEPTGALSIVPNVGGATE